MPTATRGCQEPQDKPPTVGLASPGTTQSPRPGGSQWGWSFCPSQAAPQTPPWTAVLQREEGPQDLSYDQLWEGRAVDGGMGPELSETGDLLPSIPALAASSRQEVLPGPSYSLVPTCPATIWTILQGRAVPALETRRWEFAIHEPGPGERGSVCRGEAGRRLRGEGKEAAEAEGCPPRSQG